MDKGFIPVGFVVLGRLFLFCFFVVSFLTFMFYFSVVAEVMAAYFNSDSSLTNRLYYFISMQDFSDLF